MNRIHISIRKAIFWAEFLALSYVAIALAFMLDAIGPSWEFMGITQRPFDSFGSFLWASPVLDPLNVFYALAFATVLAFPAIWAYLYNRVEMRVKSQVITCVKTGNFKNALHVLEEAKRVERFVFAPRVWSILDHLHDFGDNRGEDFVEAQKKLAQSLPRHWRKRLAA